jgi:hypothetical protein
MELEIMTALILKWLSGEESGGLLLSGAPISGEIFTEVPENLAKCAI